MREMLSGLFSFRILNCHSISFNLCLALNLVSDPLNNEQIVKIYLHVDHVSVLE